MEYTAVAIACYLSNVSESDYKKMYAQRVLANSLAQNNLMLAASTIENRNILSNGTLVHFERFKK